MAKSTAKTWVFNPKREPLEVPEKVKVQVTEKFDALVENVLKPLYVKPPPKDKRFNYLVDISTKWHRQFFYVNGTFFCPGPNRISPTFETGFVRLEYIGHGRFNVAYMRHTGKWWQTLFANRPCGNVWRSWTKNRFSFRWREVVKRQIMTSPCKIWIEQCQAARSIEDEFGVPQALAYLIGEKFLNFLEAAEDDAEFRAELPVFVAAIKRIFEPWQLAEYLEVARQTEPFDPSIYEDEAEETVEMERQADLRRSAADLLLVERAREWLLGE